MSPTQQHPLQNNFHEAILKQSKEQGRHLPRHRNIWWNYLLATNASLATVRVNKETQYCSVLWTGMYFEHKFHRIPSWLGTNHRRFSIVPTTGTQICCSRGMWDREPLIHDQHGGEDSGVAAIDGLSVAPFNEECYLRVLLRTTGVLRTTYYEYSSKYFYSVVQQEQQKVTTEVRTYL